MLKPWADADEHHHADQMTALLARIDAALGEGSKTWID